MSAKRFVIILLLGTPALLQAMQVPTPENGNPEDQLPSFGSRNPIDPIDRFTDDGNNEYLSYNSLKGARQGPMVDQRLFRWPKMRVYTDPVSNQVVAKESFGHDGKLLKREMYLNGDLHGVMNEWHENGVLKISHSYKNGVMHGRFEEWDDEGKLVMAAALEIGTGEFKRYHSNGVVREVVPYHRNQIHGTSFALTPSGQLLYEVVYKSGKATGKSIAFHDNGNVRSVAFTNDAGKLHGPIVEWSFGGKLLPIKYYVDGYEVKEDGYRRAAAKDSTLIGVGKDPEGLRKLILTQEVEARIAKYKAVPRVRIPLEDATPAAKD